LVEVTDKIKFGGPSSQTP